MNNKINLVIISSLVLLLLNSNKKREGFKTGGLQMGQTYKIRTAHKTYLGIHKNLIYPVNKNDPTTIWKLVPSWHGDWIGLWNPHTKRFFRANHSNKRADVSGVINNGKMPHNWGWERFRLHSRHGGIYMETHDHKLIGAHSDRNVWSNWTNWNGGWEKFFFEKQEADGSTTEDPQKCLVIPKPIDKRICFKIPVKKMINKATDGIKNETKKIAEKAVDGIKDKVFGTMKKLIDAVKNWVKTFVNNVKNDLVGMMTRLINGVKQLIANLRNELINFVKRMINGVKKTMTKLIEGVKKLIALEASLAS